MESLGLAGRAGDAVEKPENLAAGSRARVSKPPRARNERSEWSVAPEAVCSISAWGMTGFDGTTDGRPRLPAAGKDRQLVGTDGRRGPGPPGP